VDTGSTCVLVDLGFGPRSLVRRLREVGLEDRKIDAILLTHGHSDHTSGVVPFVKKCPVPVFATGGTLGEIKDRQTLGRVEVLKSDQQFTFGDLHMESFATSHDAAQPVGFRFQSNGVTGALATDLGEINSEVARRLTGLDWLVLESNHDENLLKLGPYPLRLKQRVLGRKGHLSNSAVARFLQVDFDGNAGNIFLAHLSRQNNHPQIAMDCARQALMLRRHSLFETCKLHLTHQAKPSIVLDL
jgi:phosphoribosyl 1,2-cyclic phosphodiesterase